MKTLARFRITFAAFRLVLLCAVAIPAPAATPTASATFIPTPTSTPTATAGIAWPLRASSNGRYLVDQNNVPFLMVYDSPWILINQGTNADIDNFLANRAAKGFTGVLVEMVDCAYGDNSPNNIDNVAPFTTPGNFSTYNPTYFNRFDYLVDQARNYGMVVLAFPVFLGYNCTGDGCGKLVNADTTAHLQSFCAYIGNRYKNKGNIIWMLVGDSDPIQCGLVAKIDAMGRALKQADPNHLIATHCFYNNGTTITRSEGVAPWVNRRTPIPSWITLNADYVDNLTFSHGKTAWNRKPAMPFFLFESYYQNDSHGMTNAQLRAQAYWSILSGHCGYGFASCPLWGLSSALTRARGCPSANYTDWRVGMDLDASNDVGAMKNFFASFHWWKGVPDFTHTTLTAGYCSGRTTANAFRASDGLFVAAYVPAVRFLTIDMTKLSGTKVAARWYDPTNGTYSTVSGSPFPNTETHVFTPTGTNSSGASDWVLLLQSGTSPTPTRTAQPSATPTPTPTGCRSPIFLSHWSGDYSERKPINKS